MMAMGGGATSVWATAVGFLERYVEGLKEQTGLLAVTERQQQQLAEDLVAAAANGSGGATLEQLLGMAPTSSGSGSGAHGGHGSSSSGLYSQQRFGSTTLAMRNDEFGDMHHGGGGVAGGGGLGGADGSSGALRGSNSSIDKLFDASSELTLGTNLTFAGGGSALMRDRRRNKKGKKQQKRVEGRDCMLGRCESYR